MKRTMFFLCSAIIALAGCSMSDITNNIPSLGGSESSSESSVPVYVNQERNAPCLETAHCLEGLTCVKVEGQTEGTCQAICTEDADCGNGFLCRTGNCQKDCAEVDEKCSKRRTCCFYDGNGDRVSDSVCKVVGEEVDPRCTLEPSAATVPGAGEDVGEPVEEELGEAASSGSSEASAPAEEVLPTPEAPTPVEPAPEAPAVP